MTPVNLNDYVLIPKRRLRQTLGGAIVALALAITLYPLWLPWGAQVLIVNEPPQKADAIVVLGGGSGDREITGARLYAEGYAPRVITTGEPIGLPGLGRVTFASLSAGELEQRGVPAAVITQLPASTTTCDDARLALAALPPGSTRVLVVTDPFHTRRAQWLFNRVAGGVDVVIIAANPSWFDAARWWTEERGIIVVGQEYVKFGMTLVKGCR